MEFTPAYKHSQFQSLFSPNAKYVASYHLAQEGFTRLHPSNPIQPHEDGGQGVIILRWAATMEVLREIEIRLYRDVLPTITEIGWSPDSSLLLAACSGTGIVMVWSVIESSSSLSGPGGPTENAGESGFKVTIQVPGLLVTGSGSPATLSPKIGGIRSISPGSPGRRKAQAQAQQQQSPSQVFQIPGFVFHGPGAPILRGVRFSADSKHILIWEEHLLRMSVWSLESRKVCAIQHPKAMTQSMVTSYSVPPFSTLGTTATTALSQNVEGGGGGGGGGHYAYSVRGDLQYVAIVERRDCKDFISIHATENFWELPAVHTFVVPELMDIAGLVWSPDGRYLVMWENPKMDYKIVAYSMEGRCHGVYQAIDTGTVSGISGPVFMGVKSVCWHPNSKMFVVGGYDQKVLWHESDTLRNDNMEGGIEYKRVDQPTQLQTVRIDNLKPNTKIGVGWCDFNSSGSLLASRNENMPNVLWIWSLVEMQPVAIIQQQSAIRVCRWDPDSPNRIVWCCGTDRVYSWKADSRIHGGDIEAVPIPIENFEVNSLRWSPEGGSLLLLDKDLFCLAYPMDENEQNIMFENRRLAFAGR
ncbi:WD repeat-containing protein wrap73 [Podila humilis]|nr:WD repeat-containing protein wrap73 [Podila humilis]